MTRAWWVLTGQWLSLPAAGLPGGSSQSAWVRLGRSKAPLSGGQSMQTLGDRERHPRSETPILTL